MCLYSVLICWCIAYSPPYNYTSIEYVHALSKLVDSVDILGCAYMSLTVQLAFCINSDVLQIYLCFCGDECAILDTIRK